ncbi:hypothetical protein BLNAU_10469 [Blattamonas nauphoetae]|uniref:Uncharacterized protein n=1 Tax=Blattamonas nauphoetae TaxID=2049346 RepID=A0ABQ9XSB5_9EUKA|nr:hypothetical protein BLNAU_10469 [Blattamonas nauphoetae]
MMKLARNNFAMNHTRNREWMRNTPPHARCPLAGRSSIHALPLVQIGVWDAIYILLFVQFACNHRPSHPSPCALKRKKTTQIASPIDNMTEIETKDLDQSSSRSFYVTSGDLQQELTERSKSIYHPLQSPSFA